MKRLLWIKKDDDNNSQASYVFENGDLEGIIKQELDRLRYPTSDSETALEKRQRMFNFYESVYDNYLTAVGLLWKAIIGSIITFFFAILATGFYQYLRGVM